MSNEREDFVLLKLKECQFKVPTKLSRVLEWVHCAQHMGKGPEYIAFFLKHETKEMLYALGIVS